ncbi:MAG TPA: 1-acyl-sn-glycerol-3-phosphate acyltransferase [Polyangiales bacterium]
MEPSSPTSLAFDPDRLDVRDPALLGRLLPLVQRFNAVYLRLTREGLEHVPRTPALFVSNHNGGMVGPDVLCTMGTLLETRGVEAPLYGLAHDFAMRQFEPLGRLAQRLGAIRACPENAARVFALGGQALVYPGGDLEAYRHSRLRDRIVLGERLGFVRVAQRAGVPIVPIVAQGAHRSAYVFDDGAWIARTLRLPERARVNRFPLALALPWGLALGPWLPYLPLPFRVRLRVLPALHVASDDDPREVQETLRTQMQGALDQLARLP